ncbi:hypothetical protein LEMLEM_LOCUS13853 [Lemmus lemmus]
MGGKDSSGQVTICPISEVLVLEAASLPGQRRSGDSPDCGL